MFFSRQKKLIIAAALLLSVFGFCAAGGSAASKDAKLGGGWQPGPADAYHPSRVIVRFSDILNKEDAVLTIEQLGYSMPKMACFESTPAFPLGLKIGIIELPKEVSVETAVKKLEVVPGILYAERDYLRYKYEVKDGFVIPDDPYFDRMWGFHNEGVTDVDPYLPGDPVDDGDIDAPEAWATHTGTDEVVVAIIDTGSYIDHLDLADNIWINEAEFFGEPGVDDDGNGYIDDFWGWNFWDNNNQVFNPDERDQYGDLNDEHGTHVSGTIGALTNNGVGVAGINWNIRIMILKFLGPEGGYSSDAILAFQYAADKEAKVINCSWGGGAFNQALKDAIEATGAIVSCAAGNTGDNTDIDPHYPSSYDSPNIISVAAMDQRDQPVDYPGWWSTCYGPETVDLYAPGGYVLSTIPPDPVPDDPGGDYAYFYGTSMAAPHVTGSAALVYSFRPDLPLYEGAHGWNPGDFTIKDAILNSVDVKPAYEGTVSSDGRLNLAQALSQIAGPIITAVDAEPRYGPPPLEVTFTASAEASPGREIADMWWDFGDDSEVVHEFDTVHIYEEQGDYMATFHVMDDSGEERTASLEIKVFYPPVVEVDPLEIRIERLEWGETAERTISISNVGLGELDYRVQVQLIGMVDASGEAAALGSGGPDEFGYFWIDSDEPGVALPEWQDISEIGTRLILGGDDSEVVDLPFEFPFYGDLKNSVRISSNGYLTFGATGTTWTPHPIPDTREPNDLIAPFWCDLEPQNEPGRVFCYGDEQKFVVQYQDVPRYAYGGAYTFQVILDRGGVIIYRYGTMLGDRLEDPSVGIENADGTIGLQLAYKEPYVHDDLGVYFLPEWVTLDKNAGTVKPGEHDLITATFAAHTLPQGTYKAFIEIHSNDPETPRVDVETFMFAKSVIPPIIESISADPWAGSAPLRVQFSAVVKDIDGEITAIEWNFGDGSAPATDTLSPIHTYEEEGEYTATLTVTDDDGLVAEDSVSIVVEDLPRASVEPREFWRVVRAHREDSDVLTVTNIGEATLIMAVEAHTSLVSDDYVPAGAGGPDSFGYLWVDSDEPGGPQFDWVEISEIGTKLDISGDDSEVVDLPFGFPFYGETKTEIRICSDGYLTFGPRGGAWLNTGIPHPDEPNDLLAVYWDDLHPPYAPDEGGVFYHYDETNNRFIVEWKEVPRYFQNGSYTFQALLYGDGTVVYQYQEMDFVPVYADRGTIGIENADGTDGLEVLYDRLGYMHDELAIRFYPYKWLEIAPGQAVLEPGESADFDVAFNLGIIGSGILDGSIVIETNDIRQPRTIVPVHLEVIPNNPPVITAAAVNPEIGPVTTSFEFVAAACDLDGHIADKWWDFGDDSDPVHEFVAYHTYASEGEFTATFTAVDNDGYEVRATVDVTVCEPASASWDPKHFSFALGQGQTAQDTLILSNTGTGTLIFGVGELPSQVRTLKRVVPLGEIKDLNAKTAQDLYEPVLDSKRSEWLPDEVGSVITSWYVPSPIGDPWGVGTIFSSDEVVIGDGLYDPTIDYIVTADGEYTGESWLADIGDWAADMAFDGTHIWQVSVGGDNAIYKYDPATGQNVGSIYDAEWAWISQRGLAYNANEDTFFIAGWNEDIIYKFKGESWDNPGEVIESWSMPVSIAGLAYHPVADVLLVTNNASPDMIYYVDATSHAIIAQFPHPAGGSYQGVGCELDRNGNLWVASWGESKMYLVETGLGAIGVDDWLTWEPGEGSVPAGGSQSIVVTVNAEKLSAGVYNGKVLLTTNDFDNPLIFIPVIAEIAAPPKIIAASAEPVFGEPPLEVTFHAEFEALHVPVVSYGWDFGDGETAGELDVTHIYSEQGIYTATFSVVDENDARDEVSFEIEVKWLPRATVDPEEIEVTLPITGSTTKTAVVGNVEGNADLDFEVKVKRGGAPLVVMPERIGKIRDELATTAEGLYGAVDPEIVEKMKAGIGPDAVGDVVDSWEVPSEIDLPWGVGFDGDLVWISDPEMIKDHLVTPFGAHTGVIFSTPWAGSWPGDMAYDSNRNLMWQVNVGGDNGIYGLNVETGEVVTSITSGVWTSVSQRGLAYDAETDTFFIGGWNEDIIYHIYGPSYDNPGGLIDAYDFPVGIAGLAWHPGGILWVTNNGAPDMIYGLDLEALEVVHQFPHPAGLDYSGAGLSLNIDGNLWVSSMDNWYMYLVNTEMPLATGGIIVDPTEGTIVKGESAELEISINAEELGKPGEVVKQHLEIKTNDPEHAFLYVDLIINIEAGPTIVEATATPEIGEPPLRVIFDAVVEPGAADIVDMWWDFGDGSDLVYEAETEHIYEEVGEYEAVFHVIDENDVEVTAELTVIVKWLPVLGVYPEEFDELLQVGEEEQTTLTVSNSGVAPMNFQITVAPSFTGSTEWEDYTSSEPVKGDYASEPRGYAGAGAGGPDEFGYIWMDSDEPGGPEFDWVEISDVGTRLPLSDESIADVNLPFAFPFYGDVKTKVRVCSNGYLTFQAGASSVWTNTPIPDSTNPNDLIAIFWDDLDPGSNGDVYYYHDQEENRFIVEYKAVSKWLGSEAYSFQAILYPNGGIVFQYLEMIGELTSATIGIEDAQGEVGLQVVYNAAYVKDGLAISFAPIGSLLRVNPTEGYILPGGSQDVVLTLGSPDAAHGVYSFYLYVSADDPYRPFATIPVTLTLNAAPAIAITAPVGGDEVQGLTEIKWTAADPDHEADELLIDLYWTRDGEEWYEIGIGLENSGSFHWNAAEVGEAGETFRLKARVTDPAEAFHEFETDEFTVINEVPDAKFSFTPSPATRRDVVKFIDESTDDGWIVAWHWDFGDGTESEEQNPEHQYAEMGEFEITLVVTDNGGLTAETAKTIEIGNAAPLAAFSFTPETPDVGEVVEFLNESTDDGEIVSCFWEFGDDVTSNEWNPEHRFSSDGVFTVKLTVIDDDNVAASVEHDLEVIYRNLPPEVEIIKPGTGQVLAGQEAIQWSATDPDDDPEDLKITLEYRLATDEDWQIIASELENSGEFLWDTSQLERGGRYVLKVTAVDPDGARGEAESGEFTVVVLIQTVVAAPNPTCDAVTFFYDIPKDGTLYVYSIAGRLMYSAELSAAVRAHEWDLYSGGRPVANGLYLYFIVAGHDKSEVGQLVVSR